MDFLIIGSGMFGAATARYLAQHATITVIGPPVPATGSAAYGAHHDEGRIIGDLSRDIVWAELNRLSRDGMTALDPSLITQCGALTLTTPDGPDYVGVAAEIRQRYGADIRFMTADQARSSFPMARFGASEQILYQPAAGHFSPRSYVALAIQSAQADSARVVSGTVRSLSSSVQGVEAALADGSRLRADAVVVASGAFAAGSDLVPEAVALRAKSEVYVMAELVDQEAAGLRSMPCINRTIQHPQLADLYVLPPIRYPDGRMYIKVGANTMIDHWLPDPAAVRAWYDRGAADGPLPALREVTDDLLPDDVALLAPTSGTTGQPRRDQWLASLAIIAAYRDQYQPAGDDPAQVLGPYAGPGHAGHDAYWHAATAVHAAIDHTPPGSLPTTGHGTTADAQAKIAIDTFNALPESERSAIEQQLAAKAGALWLGNPDLPDTYAVTQPAYTADLTAALTASGHLTPYAHVAGDATEDAIPLEDVRIHHRHSQMAARTPPDTEPQLPPPGQQPRHDALPTP